MKLKKASENLSNLLKRYDFIDAEETHQALQLGIEALKRCELVAEGYQYWHERPLPGETKD